MCNMLFFHIMCLYILLQISVDRLPGCYSIVDILEKYVDKTHYKEVYIDLVSVFCMHNFDFKIKLTW